MLHGKASRCRWHVNNFPNHCSAKVTKQKVQMVLRKIIQFLPGHPQILKALYSVWHPKRFEIRPPTQVRCQITAVIYSLLPTHTKSYKLHMSTNTEAPQSFKPTQWQCLVFKLNHQLMQPESYLSCSSVWPADNLMLSDCSRAVRKELQAPLPTLQQ